jgi:hypothetical protein
MGEYEMKVNIQKIAKRGMVLLMAVIVLLTAVEVERVEAVAPAIPAGLYILAAGAALVAGGLYFDDENQLQNAVMDYANWWRDAYDSGLWGMRYGPDGTINVWTEIDYLANYFRLYREGIGVLGSKIHSGLLGGYFDPTTGYMTIIGGEVGYVGGHPVVQTLLSAVSWGYFTHWIDPICLRGDHNGVDVCKLKRTLLAVPSANPITVGNITARYENGTIFINGLQVQSGVVGFNGFIVVQSNVDGQLYITQLLSDEESGLTPQLHRIGYSIMRDRGRICSSVPIDYKGVLPFTINPDAINIINDIEGATARVMDIAGATSGRDTVTIKVPETLRDLVGATAADVIVRTGETTVGDGIGTENIVIPVPELTGDIAKDLNAIQQVLRNITAGINTINTRISALNATIAQTISNAIAGVEARIESMTVTITGVISSSDELTNERLDAMECAITGTITGAEERIEERLDAIPVAVAVAAVGTGRLDFDPLKPKRDITAYFPFCIPFDLVRMVRGLRAEASPPRYEAEVLGYKWIIDFAEYQYIADVIRMCFLFAFAVYLLMGTSRVIRW